MAFHEVRFPPKLSFGSLGGPERRTEIVTLSNGFEERNSPWAHSRRRYDAGVGLQSLDDMAALIAFFEARAGQLHGFRWKDWADYSSALPSWAVSAGDQLIGRGDGRTVRFALSKLYRSGEASYRRPIAKPVAGTVKLAIGDVELVEGTDFTVDLTTGEVTLAVAPMMDAPVTAGFEFDVPVRFDTDRIAVSVASFEAGEVPQVPVVEVRQ
ncbi:DUF2460 domain-containing protein [Paracoccus sanguinis]|uniref:TIGR02217 family protein n=1 Tax=Paracoccus sanguinis TaxID=1545044 RepID=A0A1H2XRL9_9RHOB|nr:DUF2460 domain-containing protein [Paracoccus sanguinis]KGJ19269.1 glycoside hydrolase family 24 [Paracoccus sanguinis]SDW95513.1 TIGR02217 family protein [Paracoccus sanguinis]